MLSRCKAEKVYITAFRSMQEFRKYSADIAWETEVWIADNPDHMIQFNGRSFWALIIPKEVSRVQVLPAAKKSAPRQAQPPFPLTP
jgi:hypothetical protein